MALASRVMQKARLTQASSCGAAQTASVKPLLVLSSLQGKLSIVRAMLTLAFIGQVLALSG